MIINFEEIPAKEQVNFKGGEKSAQIQAAGDKLNKIMRITLAPGASIGMHRHETSSEIVYVLQGAGQVAFEGMVLPLAEGACHYCPKGCEHSIMNTGSVDLVFFAVVPEQ